MRDTPVPRAPAAFDVAHRIAFRASSLFINTALMLWAFSITEDPARPIDPDALTDGANVFPLPFAARFTPRIDKLGELLRREEDS